MLAVLLAAASIIMNFVFSLCFSSFLLIPSELRVSVGVLRGLPHSIYAVDALTILPSFYLRFAFISTQECSYFAVLSLRVHFT